jgi:hypothetical protein
MLRAGDVQQQQFVVLDQCFAQGVQAELQQSSTALASVNTMKLKRDKSKRLHRKSNMVMWQAFRYVTVFWLTWLHQSLNAARGPASVLDYGASRFFCPATRSPKFFGVQISSFLQVAKETSS